MWRKLVFAWVLSLFAGAARAANFPNSVSTDSNLFIAVNNVYTTLTSAISSSTGTIPASNTASFPTVGYIIIENEIVLYTAKDATHFLNCTRGSDGSSAATHLTNKLIYHSIIAAHHNVLKDELKAIEGYFLDGSGLVQLSTATGRVMISTFPATPSATLEVKGDIKTSSGTNVGGSLTVGGGATLGTPLPVTSGGTGQTALTAVKVGTATNVEAGGNVTTTLVTASSVNVTNLTASRALVSDASKNIVASGVTSTTLGYLDATSSVQTQLNAKAADNAVVHLTGDESASGIKTFTGQLKGKGTATNDAASAGYIGEYASAGDATAHNIPTSGQWGDLVSLSLTAGDWMVVGQASYYTLNGASITGTTYIGLSTTSGNNGTGMSLGLQMVTIQNALSTSNLVGGSVTTRMSLSGTTTVYLKMYCSGYTTATPQIASGIQAWRVR